MEREREKKARVGKCLSSALERSAHGPDGWTVMTSYVCNRKHVTSSGASVHHIYIFSIYPESIAVSEQVGVQWGT